MSNAIHVLFRSSNCIRTTCLPRRRSKAPTGLWIKTAWRSQHPFCNYSVRRYIMGMVLDGIQLNAGSKLKEVVHMHEADLKSFSFLHRSI